MKTLQEIYNPKPISLDVECLLCSVRFPVMQIVSTHGVDLYPLLSEYGECAPLDDRGHPGAGTCYLTDGWLLRCPNCDIMGYLRTDQEYDITELLPVKGFLVNTKRRNIDESE